MPGIGIIVNPHSRDHKLDPSKAERLGFIVGDKGSCHTTKDINEVEELARDFKNHKIEILGISGGDGTNHATLTTFLKVYGNDPLPKIVFLRGGTMNLLANCLQIKGAPEKILSNLILTYHEDKPFKETELNMLKVNNLYGFLFGTCAVSNFMNKYNSRKNGDPTPWRAFKLLSKTTLSALFNTNFSLRLFERVDVKITVVGKPAPFKNYNLIIAGTIEELGFGFKPLYNARKEHGKFHMLSASTTPRKLLSTLPHTFFSSLPKSEDFFDVCASNVTIEFEKPFEYTVDGDMPEPSTKIEISTGPKLKVIIA